MASATIDLGLNVSSFEQGLASAESKAKSFTGRIEGLFRRSPGKRAETALAGFAGDLATGNVTGAISGLTARMSGFGLAVGVALGTGVELFTKFKAQVDATDKSAKALAQHLALPRSTVAAFSPEGIHGEAESFTKQIEDLSEKRQSFGSRLTNFLDEYVNPALGTSSRHKGKAQQNEIDSAAKRLGETLSDQAGAEEKILNLRREGLEGSERNAKLGEIDLKRAEGLAKIDKERRDFKLGLFNSKVSPEARDRLVTNNEAAAARRAAGVEAGALMESNAVRDQLKWKEREAEIQNRLLNLHDGTLSKDQQSLAIVKERIGLFYQRITQAQSPEQKAALGLQVRGLVNEEDDLLYAEHNKSWAQKAGERHEQEHFSQFVRGQTPSNPNAYLTHPDAYARSPDAYNGPNDTHQDGKASSFRADLDAVMARYWGN